VEVVVVIIEEVVDEEVVVVVSVQEPIAGIFKNTNKINVLSAIIPRFSRDRKRIILTGDLWSTVPLHRLQRNNTPVY
jgi:hypothetical protein